jgi:hypothetical protein
MVFIFIINVRHSRTELLLCIRDGVERCARCSFSYMCAALAPNWYFGSMTVWNAVRGVHFHHRCAPLPHRIATLYPPRSITVLRCVRGAHCQRPWLSLAAPAAGFSWAAPGCSWLLLAAHGCSWLPLAAPGCLWLLLMSTVDPKKTTCLGFTLGSYRFLHCNQRGTQHIATNQSWTCTASAPIAQIPCGQSATLAATYNTCRAVNLLLLDAWVVRKTTRVASALRARIDTCQLVFSLKSTRDVSVICEKKRGGRSGESSMWTYEGLCGNFF